MTDDDFEFILKPQTVGGQQVGTPRPHVICIHKKTGLAYLVDDQRSMYQAKEVALETLRGLLLYFETMGVDLEVK